MIIFLNKNSEDPYVELHKKYLKAVSANQKNIDAILIASYDISKKEVDSRYVNLKFIDDKKLIFFTNYDSPKSFQFKNHNQIAATFFWESINVQIRIKAKIKKTTVDFNKKYFSQRSVNKNALAISSNQSKRIKSYSDVVKKYNEVKKSNILKECPSNWGGYEISPYYFEFWEGHESRLNKRKAYTYENKCWKMFYLEP